MNALVYAKKTKMFEKKNEVNYNGFLIFKHYPRALSREKINENKQFHKTFTRGFIHSTKIHQLQSTLFKTSYKQTNKNC